MHVFSEDGVDTITYDQTLQMYADVMPSDANHDVTWSVRPLTGDVLPTIGGDNILRIVDGTGTVEVTATSVRNRTIKSERHHKRSGLRL
ncbi:hypothetical protein [Paenibacillus macerans]|uniref:hypothetical protein n=1 Tax=Paenibacillus macerans TaxID=44252 RepID=UPI003D315921